jgi:aminodeoxyfutalosine synthase
VINDAMIVSTDFDALAASHDILAIGMAADEVRRRLHGVQTTFVRVAEVTALPGESFDVPAAAGEVRIVGTPASRTAACRRIAEVVEAARSVPVSAFSLADLERLSAAEGVTLRALLEDLQAAGLDLVADAPFDRLQDPRRSIEEVNIAGLALARLTIDQVPGLAALVHLRQIAALQRTVAVIRAFAPLPRRLNPLLPTTGYDDVKRIALSRLIVQNVPSIQVDWALYGPKLAQVALTVGADDVDGVSALDDSPDGPRRAPLEEILRNIRAAGFEPLERNGSFEPRA